MGILKQMTRKVLSSLLACIISTVIFANPVVTDITAKQRFPWNGLVDITVTLSGTEEECKVAACKFLARNKATNAELPMASVKALGPVTGDGSQWIRRFVWNAVEDIGKAKFGEVVLTVGELAEEGVQLWENGPYWAECNVGATKPEEFGYYFWWGDTIGYKRNAANNGWVTGNDGSSFTSFDYVPTDNKTIEQLQADNYINLTGNLVAEHDAATAHLGAPWRMPTADEIDALISNCMTTWTTSNGVRGRLVSGKGVYSSKSIFLPAAGFGSGSGLYYRYSDGYYWSSTPHSDDPFSIYLSFNSGDFFRDGHARGNWRSVRPLRGFAK